MEQKLRRNQNALVILGAGVIAFGFWSGIKTILVYFLQTDKMNEIAAELGEGVGNIPPMLLLWIIVSVILGIDLLLRLYVGLSARAEGFGRKRGRAYLVVAALMIVFFAAAIIFSITSFSLDNYDSILDAVVTFAVDLTTMITLRELFVAAIRVKKLTRALEKEG